MKKTKSRKPLDVLRPGEVNEFWENVLRSRDLNDARWTKTYSPAFKFSALAYERNRDLVIEKKLAA